MNTIKNVLRANGFITSYVEDEELFTITRNGEGKPTFVRSTRGRWVSQEATFIYDQAGKFTGLSQEIDTAMLAVLVSEASGVVAGGGGGGAWGGITGTLSDQTDLQAALDTKASALAPVSLSANTTLTRAAHYNRLIVVDVSGGNVTLTATGTDALLGDFISVDVIGGGSNTVTLAGVTAQSGYQLTAVSGGNVEARCDVAASFIASTRTISAGAGATATLALVNGDFTSNNLNLTATHTNRVLDCSAVTVPVTLTIQTDASGGYDTTAAELKVLGSLTAPVAIIEGTGATVVGKVQVIEPGCWGGARRMSANTWALVREHRTDLAVAPQFGLSVPNHLGNSGLTNIAMLGPSAIDGSAAGTGAAYADTPAEYGVLRRVRYTAAAPGTYRTAGFQHGSTFRLGAVNGSLPVVARGAIADAITAATAAFLIGFGRDVAVGTTWNAVGFEPSAASTIDMIALGGDTSDTNMQIMHRNGGSSTAATKIDLGASFPKSQFVAYELRVYKNAAGTAFLAVARNMNTNVFAVKILTTNVPRNTMTYSSLFVRASGNNATPAAALDFIGFHIGATA